MKNKIKKILIGLICAVFIASTLTSCEVEIYDGVIEYCDLVPISSTRHIINGNRYRVYADKNTGVCYLVSGTDGITVLVDAEGKPIIREGFDENTGR